MDIENNKLIATFMEFETSNADIYTDYQRSWDWLMPVLNKAREIWLTFEFDSPESEHLENEIFTLDNTLSELLGGDIDSIYQRIVEFIKWYNKQEK